MPDAAQSSGGGHFPTSHRRTPRIGTPLLHALERVDALFDRLATSAYNPLYQSGPLIIVSLLILVVTGVYLFLFYSVSAPYETMERIQSQVFAGRWIRALHRYAADASIVFTVLHALRLFLQGRTWGQRALAWLSGVVMTVFLWVCGWTGFVLVWDVQGFVIALQGAHIIDLLPLFPEPIASQFSSDAMLGSMFFFVNLFAHVALPLGLALGLWIHVARVAHAALFPPRALWMAMVGGLTLLSIVWPIALDAPARLDRMPAQHSVDWLFQFWLPLADAPWAAAGLWLGAGAIALSAPWWWRPRRAERPQVSSVNERLCEGCRQCYLDCPYEAISMIPRTLGTGSAEVAHVTPDLCVSCGACSASCDVFRVGPPGRTGKDQLISLRSLIESRSPKRVDAPPAQAENDDVGANVKTGDLVVFACTQSAMRLRALERRDLVVVPVECAGSLHMYTVHAALKRGARGVVVWSCPPRNCQFREGASLLSERLLRDRKTALPESADRTRVMLLDAGPGEIADALARIDAFDRRVRGLASEANASPSSDARRTWPGRVVVAGVLLGGLGAASLTTTGAEPEHATLRLSWRHDVGLVERCRTPSPQELAALPMHMRRPKICDRRYPALHVVVRVDGEVALDRVVEPGGAQKDRAPHVAFDVAAAGGEHLVAVTVSPVLTDAEPEDATTRPLTLSERIVLEPGGIARVSWDRASHSLALIPPRPR